MAGFDFGKRLTVFPARVPAARILAVAAALAVAVVASPASAGTRDGQATVSAPSPYATTAVAFSKAANAKASAIGAGGSCFGAQLDTAVTDAAVADRVARSTVFVAAVDRKGYAIASGSGFVVRGSGDGTPGSQRILTARHVATMSGMKGVVAVLAFSSTGAPLGELSQVATGSARNPKLEDSYRGRRDISVMSVKPLSAEQSASYSAIPGLDIARVQSTFAVYGLFGSSSSAGVDKGQSGGPLFDKEGKVHGVVDQRAELVTGPDAKVDIEVPSIQSWVALGSGTMHVRANRATMAIFAPVSDPEVLGALGKAGSGIATLRSVRGPIHHAGTPFAVAGFQAGGCMVSEGRLNALVPLDASPSAVAATEAMWHLPAGSLAGMTEHPSANPARDWVMPVSASATPGSAWVKPVEVAPDPGWVKPVAVPVAPVPGEVRTTRNGTVVTYGDDGKVATVTAPDGRTVSPGADRAHEPLGAPEPR